MHQLCNVLRKDYLHGLLQQSDYKHFSPASLLYLYMYMCVCVLLTSPLTYTHTLKKNYVQYGDISKEKMGHSTLAFNLHRRNLDVSENRFR